MICKCMFIKLVTNYKISCLFVVLCPICRFHSFLLDVVVQPCALRIWNLKTKRLIIKDDYLTQVAINFSLKIGLKRVTWITSKIYKYILWYRCQLSTFLMITSLFLCQRTSNWISINWQHSETDLSSDRVTF